MTGLSARTAGLFTVASHAVVRAGLAAGLMIAACEQVQNAIANGDTRALTLHHTHTKEDLTVTFKRNGRYDEEGLQKLNRFLRDWRNGDQTRMDPKLFDIVWEVYRELGAADPVQIISAYRSPQTNAMLRRRGRGVARHSQHILGKAMDFYIPGVALEDVRAAGLRLQRGGVGYYPTSGSPFVHLDTGNVRHWPRMSPDQIARVWPRGRPTVLAKADAGQVNDADVDPKPKDKRGLLAKLFGFGAEEDDEDLETRASTLRMPAIVRQAHAEPARPLAEVPIPTARPAIVAAKSAPAPANSGFALASAAATPAPAPSANAAQGQRLVWTTGPQAHPVGPKAEGGTDMTASVTPWPIATEGEKDRVPRDIALAYAATATPAEVGLPKATPMGTPRPVWQAPSRASAPQPAAAPARPNPSSQVKAGTRLSDPWLRGVVMSPSVHYSMQVAVLGPLDYRSLRTHMHKPRAVLAKGFSLDPHDGMTSEGFNGPAITFMPVITFSSRTASLN